MSQPTGKLELMIKEPNSDESGWPHRSDAGEPAGQPEVDEATAARLVELSEALVGISEQIGDLSIDLVRTAIEAGSARPVADRQLAKARRSVDKAAFLLAGIGP